MAERKIIFLDISVYDRAIGSIEQEKSTTRHSIGYLDHLGAGIEVFALRFGAKNQAAGNWRLFTYGVFGVLSAYRFLKKIRPDVVMFHSFRFPIRFILLKVLLPNAKFIVQHHAGDPSPNPVKRVIQSFCYSKADMFNFVTRDQVDAFRKAGIISTESQILETMIGSTGFRLLDQAQCRKMHGIGNDDFVMVWVGHLNANKDPLCLLRAVARLKADGVKFTLLMFFGQEILLEPVRALVEQQGLQERVVLKCKIENPKLASWLNAADCFVSCSHYEGSGIALAEALACGCVPVVTQIPSFSRMTPRTDLQFGIGDDEEMYMKIRMASELDFTSERDISRKFFDERLSFKAIGQTVGSSCRAGNPH